MRAVVLPAGVRPARTENVRLTPPEVVLGDVEQRSVSEAVVVGFKLEVPVPASPRRVPVKVPEEPLLLVLGNSHDEMAVSVPVLRADNGREMNPSSAGEPFKEALNQALVAVQVREVPAGERDERHAHPSGLLGELLV